MSEHACEAPGCGKPLPNGGVLDDVDRRVHYWCRQRRKLEIAEQARTTASRVAKYGRPSQKPPRRVA